MSDAYGRRWPQELSPLEIELLCFRDNLSRDRGGLGAYGHFKRAAMMLWPNMDWHPWLTERARALCNGKINAWTGAGAAGKTHDAGLFGMLFWLADPLHTSVILTSTTGKMVRKRIWPVIQQLYNDAPNMVGNLVDSKTTLQSVKGNDKCGIFALAVREGPVSKAVADIQGLHNKRMFMVIDEGTDAPEAVLEAVSNLRKGCSDFRLLIIGNAASRLDPHGILCEPKDGWNSVDVGDAQWETKGNPRWEIEPGLCLHFDGMESPNVKLGQDKWPYLFTNVDLNRALAAPGAAESVGFWKYTRGFWPPEGLCKTVLSEALVERHHGRGQFTFISEATLIAGLDPGFGGDKCILRTGVIGDLPDGRMGLQLRESFVIVISANSKEPVHYQIVRQVKQICQERRIKPSSFGLDASGEGGGLASIFEREWGGGIHWIEFGGNPSDTPIGAEDRRPACDVYDRRVTELAFSVRELVINEQLRGLTDEEVKQFCAREFSDEKRKIKLDTKDECKKKIGHSPDEADAVEVLVAVSRRMGLSPGGGGAGNQDPEWLEIALQKDSINHRDGDEEGSGLAGDDLFELSTIV